MRTELTWKKRIIRWVIAAVLLLVGVGIAFAGEQVFATLGLPVWSDGDRGWNYVGVTTYVIFAAGISVCNSTLSEKVRRWLWAAVVALAAIWFCLPTNR